ncbi:uncharacterized protein LOC130645989 [Hydractinia symbiolongicarpus]|uniref:uncharacterized protein LOC130645989 n=1 Tax=Hydractinia symbiolongicarpus TaxID=13093 RepID=UPI00254B22F4|nr:uncharacterized protein LOC130645989 [Hydractinia symbiolongicarpus]
MDCLLPTFIANKVDDSIAHLCTEKINFWKWVYCSYGDLLSLRQTFPNMPGNQTSGEGKKHYRERAEELKQKLKRTHTCRLNACKKLITIKSSYHINFGIKCFEKKKYTLKLHKGFSQDVKREATYHDHTICRIFFQVSAQMATFIGLYNNKSILDSFTTVENFSYLQREKKKAIHMYLYVPVSYESLQFKTFIENIKVNDPGADDLIEFNTMTPAASPKARMPNVYLHM